MPEKAQGLLDAQQDHWEKMLSANADMFGAEASEAAMKPPRSSAGRERERYSSSALDRAGTRFSSPVRGSLFPS